MSHIQTLQQNFLTYVSDEATKPILDDDNEQDKNEEAAKSELNNDFDKLPTRNQNDERADGIGLIGNPDEPERLYLPENVMEIDDDSDVEELETMEMNNNNENYDDPENDRYKIAGMDDEQYDDGVTGVHEAQNGNADVNLGRGKRKKSKNPWYFNQETVNTIIMKPEPKNENHVGDNVFDANDDENIMPAIVKYVLIQYNLKQGIAKNGKRVDKATEKELSQIHNLDALKPLDANTLTADEKKNMIASLIFYRKKGWYLKGKAMCRWQEATRV